MVYKVIGIMSGSSLDGLDIVYAELQETAGKWEYEIVCHECLDYTDEWLWKLETATNLPGKDYQLLHTEYGHFIGKKINDFIDANNLQHKVALVSSHGHTTFHMPEKKMTHQIGDGAAIAAETRLPVVSDLRALDVAFGGQGAPIVPLGEKLLFAPHEYFLNLGGIANISIHRNNVMIAYDICPANRILNMLASQKDLPYDDKGSMAARGTVNELLLQEISTLEYYSLPYPKSLANSYGIETVFPLIKRSRVSTEDGLATYTQHVVQQIKKALEPSQKEETQSLFITGGGAFNTFLIQQLTQVLAEINFTPFVPDDKVVANKEALIMALLGVLRWREQDTVLASVTGAARNSIGGALWLGTEA